MPGAQILVVEDEVVVARDLQQSLSEMGYRVPEIALSGAEAIAKVERSQPDLVLMDIRLKGDRDGIEAAAELRERFGTPVVYLTAYADEATLGRAKLTQPFGYILKPYQTREVQTTIEVSLYKHQMEQQLRTAHAALQEAHDDLAFQLRVADGRDRLVQCQMRGPTQAEAHEEILQVLELAMPAKEVMLFVPRADGQLIAAIEPRSSRTGQGPAATTQSPPDGVAEACRTLRPQCSPSRTEAAVPVLYRQRLLGVIWAVADGGAGAFSQQVLNGLWRLASQAALLLRMAAVTTAIDQGTVGVEDLLDLD